MHSCIVRPRIGDAFMQRAAVNRRCMNASCGLKGLSPSLNFKAVIHVIKSDFNMMSCVIAPEI